MTELDYSFHQPWHYQLYGFSLASSDPIPGLVSSNTGQPADLAIWFGPKAAANGPWSEEPQRLVYSSPDLDESGKPILTIWEVAASAYTRLVYRYGIQFLLDRAASTLWVTWPSQQGLEDAAALLLQGLVMGYILRRRGVTYLHASAVAVQDRAIALMGPGGAGKSVLAAALVDLGYPLISDDLVALKPRAGQFLAQPGHPRIHLWPDAVRLLGRQIQPLLPGWEKGYLDLAPAGQKFLGVAQPLGVVYMLDRRPSQSTLPGISALTRGEALAGLMAQIYVPYLMEEEMRLREFGLLGNLVERVPVRRLAWRSGSEGLRLACVALLEDVAALG